MTLFYDGECGFCHGTVRFFLAIDKHALITFSPLQGAHLKSYFSEGEISALPDSIVLRLENGTVYLKSSAVAEMLVNIGGVWRPFGVMLRVIPAGFRDLVYDAVGKVRKRLVRTPPGLCPVVSPAYRARFID